MTIESLFGDLDVKHSPQEATQFYEELAAVSRDATSLLGGSSRKTASMQNTQELIEQLNNAANDIVALAPQLEVFSLKKSNFKKMGLEIGLFLSDLFKRYNFYLINIPVTIYPRSGWMFEKLECIIEFNPKQAKGKRPVAYQVFPAERWQTLVQAEQSLRIGLNENLEFDLDSNQLKALPPGLQNALRSGIGLNAGGSAALVVGPFNYTVRRPKILTRGLKTPKTYWRLEGSENVTEEEPCFGIVLQVSKDIPRVDAVGAVKATRNFNFWASFKEELFDYVREGTKAFFKDEGAPIPDGKLWENLLEGI